MSESYGFRAITSEVSFRKSSVPVPPSIAIQEKITSGTPAPFYIPTKLVRRPCLAAFERHMWLFGTRIQSGIAHARHVEDSLRAHGVQVTVPARALFNLTIIRQGGRHEVSSIEDKFNHVLRVEKIVPAAFEKVRKILEYQIAQEKLKEIAKGAQFNQAYFGKR